MIFGLGIYQYLSLTTVIRFSLLKLRYNPFINIECQDLCFPNKQIVLEESQLIVQLYDHVL